MYKSLKQVEALQALRVYLKKGKLPRFANFTSMIIPCYFEKHTVVYAKIRDVLTAFQCIRDRGERYKKFVFIDDQRSNYKDKHFLGRKKAQRSGHLRQIPRGYAGADQRREQGQQEQVRAVCRL